VCSIYYCESVPLIHLCKLGRLEKGARPFPEHMVFHDTGVSNTPTTLETISDLCVIMYGLHVRINDECTCNILMNMLMSI
jgi:hypothetical protein